MERLTYRPKEPYISESSGDLIKAYSDADIRAIINRLADYEDTGLTPEEISDSGTKIARQQKCIAELWRFLDQVESNARHHDLSLLRVRSGASGCDMFQGLPPISRIVADIECRYNDLISEAVRSSENEVSDAT